MVSNMAVIIEKEILGKEFKIYGTYEEPLFLGKDVAEWLSVRNHRDLLRRVDEEEKVVGLNDTLGGRQETLFLTEDGLYEVLMQSRKPVAREFKREVKKILKDVRKNGLYVKTNLLDGMVDNPDLAIEMLKRLKAEKDKAKELENGMQQQAPKVLFANAVATAGTTILVGELAKLIRQNGVEIGQNRLFKWLRENGYLIKKKGFDYNMPTQKAMELELFKVKETVITRYNGETEINKTTKVTGKGQVYFINKFLVGLEVE